MNDEELHHVAMAVAVAAHQIEDRLDEDMPAVPMPDDILASIESEDEFEEAAEGWLKEAHDELARRQGLVEAERERRRA